MKQFLDNKEKHSREIGQGAKNERLYNEMIRIGASEKAKADFKRPAYTNVSKGGK